MKIGISHTTMFDDDGTIAQPAIVAGHVENLGLDSLWVSDHLAWGTPILDSAMALTAAAAVSERIELGFSVLQLAMRRLAWIAKQLGTLQVISAGRVNLGVGVGGHPPEEWAAAGMPLHDRGARTDAALRVLPELLSGRPTRLPDAPDAEIALRPATPMPPLWIGGSSPAALARAARFRAGWLPAAVTPHQVAEGRDKITELGGTRPPVTVAVFATLNAHVDGMPREALVDLCANEFGFARDHADAVVIGGKPAEVAERLHEFAGLGVAHLVVVPFGTGWADQCEFLAESRALLAG